MKLYVTFALATAVLIVVLTSETLTAGVGLATAHHSQAAAFHMDQWVEIEGIVQRWLFRNPHPVLYVEVIGESNEPVTWQIEFAPATVLAKRGWNPETFVPGQDIAARGHPSRAEGTYGMAAGAEITREDDSQVR
jgi:hypothetical protein